LKQNQNQSQKYDLFSDFYRVDKLLKKIKDKREELRGAILDEATISNLQEYYNSPTKSLRIPKSYFDATGHTVPEFAELRYPGWDLNSYTQEGDDAILIFKKKAKYGSFTHTSSKFRTTVISSEPTPLIDWETLEKEFPGMTDRIAQPIITYEINEDKFNRELDENPELTEIMQRHIISKAPIMKVSSKEIKSE